MGRKASDGLYIHVPGTHVSLSISSIKTTCLLHRKMEKSYYRPKIPSHEARSRVCLHQRPKDFNPVDSWILDCIF